MNWGWNGKHDGYFLLSLMDAFKGSTNCNANIVLTNGKFPELPPGDIAISTTGLSSLVVTPRWWTI